MKMLKGSFVFVLGVLFTLSACTEKKQRTSILGGWNVTEINEISGLQRIYHSNIVRDPVNNDQYLIYNFHNLGDDPNIVVSVMQNADGSLEIPNQVIEGSNATVVGAGTVKPDFSNIEWKYIFNDGVEQLTVANYY